jgi:hypothetical protein
MALERPSHSLAALVTGTMPMEFARRPAWAPLSLSLSPVPGAGVRGLEQADGRWDGGRETGARMTLDPRHGTAHPLRVAGRTRISVQRVWPPGLVIANRPRCQQKPRLGGALCVCGCLTGVWRPFPIVATDRIRRIRCGAIVNPLIGLGSPRRIGRGTVANRLRGRREPDAGRLRGGGRCMSSPFGRLGTRRRGAPHRPSGTT